MDGSVESPFRPAFENRLPGSAASTDKTVAVAALAYDNGPSFVGCGSVVVRTRRGSSCVFGATNGIGVVAIERRVTWRRLNGIGAVLWGCRLRARAHAHRDPLPFARFTHHAFLPSLLAPSLLSSPTSPCLSSMGIYVVAWC